MKLTALITDNLTELLVKIIEFTHIRQKILIRNMNSVDEPDYIPKDLAVDEFCSLLSGALDEHLTNQRLLLVDSSNIKFGLGGDFEPYPVVDDSAVCLRQQNRNEYLEVQINKILENTLNQRVAAELLRCRNDVSSAPE